MLSPSPINSASGKHIQKIALALAIASTVCACSKDPLTSGSALLEKGDITSAVIEFKNAVQNNPQSLPARLALASALERTSDSIGAEQHLRKALDNDGDAEKLVPRIALMMLDRGEHAKIVNEFSKRTLKTPSGISDLKAILSMAEAALGHPKQATELLEGLAIETPLSKLARGQMLAQQGKASEAIESLDAAIKLAGKDDATTWWTYRALHRTYAAAGDQAKALMSIRSAFESAPWHVGIGGEYGDALIGANQFTDAAVVHDKLKKLAPNHYWTHYLSAVLLAEKGDIEGSHAAGLKVLSVAPGHLRSNLIVASAELQKGSSQMAEERLRKVLHEHPRHLGLLQLYATAQLRNGNYAAAAESVERGLRVSPDDRRLMALSVDLAVMKKDIPAAKKLLQRMLALNDKDGQSLMRLAELSILEKRPTDASSYLEKATPYIQDDPVLRDRSIALALNFDNIEIARKLSDHALNSRPSDPGSQLTVAAIREKQNDIPGAKQAALKALDLKADFQPALNALGSLVRSQNDQVELLNRYEKAVAAKPSTPETYQSYMQYVRLTKGDDSKIASALEKGVAAHPTATLIRANLIDELFRAGRFDDALASAQSGASITNGPADLSALLAQTYERMNKTEQATEIYRKLATSYPQRTDWRLKLAELSVSAGNTKEAQSILRSLMTDAPFETASYIALAKLTVKDNLSEALSIARQMGEKKANQRTAMLLEGDLLVMAGKPDDALLQFNKAAKAGVMPEAAISTVQLLDKTGRSPSADQEVAEALRKFPANPQLLAFAGQRQLQQGNPDKAVEYFQKALAITPRNLAYVNNLAWAQTQQRKPQAVDTARFAANAQPNNPTILDTYGVALMRNGEIKTAIGVLKAASNLAPYAGELKLHLAEGYLADGDKKRAREIVQSIQPANLSKSDQESLERLRKETGA